MPKTFKFLIWSGKKAVAFLVLTILLSVAIVGSTLAYIIVKTNQLNNTFTPGTVDISISGDDIKNDGDVEVYVRAAVVVTWVNKDDGTTLYTMPKEGTDYTVEFNTAGGWVKGSDGFWYYTTALKAMDNNSTEDEAATLINSIVSNTTVEGYNLTVQVLSSAIQAEPDSAAEQSWNVTIENGVLTPPTTP